MLELTIATVIVLIMVASWFILPAVVTNKPAARPQNEGTTLPQSSQPQV